MCLRLNTNWNDPFIACDRKSHAPTAVTKVAANQEET